MLLAAFLRHFDSLPPEKYRTLGASSLGRCARALAMSAFPDQFKPAPMTARRRARLMAGRHFEASVLGVIRKELAAHTADETAFLWPVDLDAGTFAAAEAKIATGRYVGFVLPAFDRNDIPRWRAACAKAEMNRLGGIILDPKTSTVYIPALADGIADLSPLPEFAHDRYALASVEFKTMATAGFRRVLGGVLDYGYRTQFAIEVDAAELDAHAALFYRLETAHAIEIVYARKADRLRATWTLSNGSRIVKETDLEEPDAEWDEVQIEVPFDGKLLDQARQRLRRVLAATPTSLPDREAGPDFTCHECSGTGGKVCGFCTEEGISKRSIGSKRSGGAGKPCTRCQGTHRRVCAHCEGSGRALEAELPWQCGYCPFKESCWVGPDGPIFETKIEKRAFRRPRFVISRETYEASGLTFARIDA